MGLHLFIFICRVAFKSVATISQQQPTAQYDGTPGTLAAKGRHDPCVLPRAVPIVETVAALTLMELVVLLNDPFFFAVHSG